MLLKEAKAAGYKLNLVYVGIRNAHQSNSRVVTRVHQGGHDVAETDVYRRFSRSLENLPKAIALCDRVRILDNAGADFRFVLSIDNDKAKFVSKRLPKWLVQSVSIPKQWQRNHDQER